MAFDNDNFTPVGGHTGHAGGVFFYETTDTPATVEGANYFDSVSNKLEDDCLLIVSADTDSGHDLRLYRPTISSGAVTLNQFGGEGTLTDSSGGTANDTITAVSGSGADSTINNNFADLTAKVNFLLQVIGA